MECNTMEKIVVKCKMIRLRESQTKKYPMIQSNPPVPPILTPLSNHILPYNTITMARMRNNHGLYGNRSFSIPTHEQRYMFFSLEDKVNGVMADWIMSVQNENWERHDFDNCTVFNFLSHIHGCKATV
jgi:hypothetical protein